MGPAGSGRADKESVARSDNLYEPSTLTWSDPTAATKRHLPGLSLKGGKFSSELRENEL